MVGRRDGPDGCRRTVCTTVHLFAVVLWASACTASAPQEVTPTLFPQADLRDMSDFQRQIVEDGVVTLHEYRVAVEATAACVAADGWEVGPVAESPVVAGHLGYSVHLDPLDPGVDRRLQDSQDRCNAEYRDYVELGYRRSTVLTGVERAERMDSLIACLAEFGVENVERDWSAEEFVGAIVERDPEEVRGLVCMDRHARLFR